MERTYSKLDIVYFRETRQVRRFGVVITYLLGLGCNGSSFGGMRGTLLSSNQS